MRADERRTDGVRLARAGLAAALCLVLVPAACTDAPSPSGPDRGVVDVAFQAPDGLQGVGGAPLSAEVAVVTLDDAGDPRPGTAVELTTPDGGSVRPRSGTTDASARLEVAWTPGRVDTAEVQRLVARAAGTDGDAADTLEATVRPQGGDVLIVRGAEEPLKGALVLRQIGFNLTVFEEHVRPDTVIDLQPRNGGASAASFVAVFPGRRRPALRQVAWTPGADSVIVELAPPVGVDLKIRIHAAPFEATRAIAREHLEAVRRVWAEEGVGLVLDSVEFVDRTDGGRVDILTGELDETCDQPPGKVIDVDYVHSVDRNFLSGYGCPPDNAFMGLNSEQFTNMLAHELGHVFTLKHTETGLMRSSSPGSALTGGQIFKIHFDERSGVNAVFGAHSGVARSCPGGCLPATFEFGS